jgi:hypothetical protein
MSKNIPNTTANEETKIDKTLFERTLKRLIEQDKGEVQIFRTSDVGNRSILWKPFPEISAYVQFHFINGEIQVSSNLASADF